MSISFKRGKTNLDRIYRIYRIENSSGNQGITN